MTVAELRRGIELLADGRRRTQLATWIDQDFSARFGQRLLPVSLRVADEWGIVMARAKRQGVGLSVIDGLLAATAIVHDLRIATRNGRDFEPLGLSIFNPWID